MWAINRMIMLGNKTELLSKCYTDEIWLRIFSIIGWWSIVKQKFLWTFFLLLFNMHKTVFYSKKPSLQFRTLNFCSILNRLAPILWKWSGEYKSDVLTQNSDIKKKLFYIWFQMQKVIISNISTPILS